jgi:hypothetical protein
VSAFETQGVTVWRGDLSARVTDWGMKKRFYDAIYTATKNHVRETMERISERVREVSLSQ